MQTKDEEISPKGKELESEKTTPKKSMDLSDEEILEIHRKMRSKMPWMKNKIDLYGKGVLNDPEVSPETSNSRLFPPAILSQRMKDFLHGKIPGEGKL